MKRRVFPVALALVLSLALSALSLLVPLQRYVSDLRAGLLLHEPHSDVLIVGIDARSLRELNQWPWSRDIHARMLAQLKQADPRAVFVDIDFSVASTTPVADQALADELSGARDHTVILPVFWQDAAIGERGSRVLTRPLPGLAAHAELGLVNVIPEADGLIRSIVHYDQAGPRRYLSAGAQLAGREDFVVGQAYPVDFSLSPTAFDYVSYVDVLNGRVPAEQIKGRTVLVGATAEELGDYVPVPVHRSLPGVTLQALSYTTLRTGVPQPAGTVLTVAILVCLLTLWLGLSQRGWRAQMLTWLLVASAAGVTSLLLARAHNVYFDPVLPVVFASLCAFFSIIAGADRQALAAVLANLKLRREQALISGVFSTSIDGILVVDRQGHIRDANAAASGLLEVPQSSLLEQLLYDFFPQLRPELQETDTDLATGRRELKLQTDQGVRTVELAISAVGEAAPGLHTVILRDITERQRQQAMLKHQANHDALTGLANRACLVRHLESLKAGHRAALYVLDLDSFKQINDTLGHDTGDQVLRALARRLREAMPDNAKVYRIGGDEFAVLYTNPHSDQDDILKLSERLTQQVRAPVQQADTELRLNASTGIALYPQHTPNGAMLLRRADVAMYAAKANRNGAEFYDAAADQNTIRHLQMAGALRRALEQNALHMVYQPKIRLSDGRCCGVEALVRWTDPELGVVSPAEFVPLAEACDLIEPLTQFTMRQALGDFTRWCAGGVDVVLSLNLSARHVFDPDFMRWVLTEISSRGIDPRKIEMEITETAVMQSPEHARGALSLLTSQGIQLAMDDYGTGFSSLAYLKYLNLNTLKIDQCFVRDMLHSEHDRKIIASTLSMAHSLELEVVAEGVESDAHAALLAEMGCGMGQGYGFAQPMPPAEFIDWYKGRHAAVQRPRKIA